MPDYRRWFVPGGTFFFTLVTARRAPIFRLELARRLLRETLAQQQLARPFHIDAIVLLPDHLHTIWTLPSGDAGFSLRWSAIKGDFTRRWLAAGGKEQRVYPGQRQEGRRGIWQPRFIEHTIRDEQDLSNHVDYLHFNPVKHGLVRSVKDWPYSSFHRFVEMGEYEPDWGRGDIPPPSGVAAINADLLE